MGTTAAHASPHPDPQHRPRGRRGGLRRAALFVLCTALVLGTAALPAAASAGPAPVTASVSPSSGVELTSKTVVISRRLAKKQLTSVSKDGAVYRFKSVTGALTKLRKGKVMLVSGLAARDVTKTRKVHGHLVVRTAPAELTDVVRNGTLDLDKAIDFSRGVVLGGAAVPPEARVGVHVPLLQRAGLQPLSRRAGVTIKGTVEGYTWEVTFTPSATGVAVEVKITRASPVELSVSVSGTLDNLRTGGTIAVTDGQVSQAQMLANNLQGSFTLKYAAKPISAFGLGQAGGIKVELPAEILVPFVVGGMPFFLGVRVAFFAAAGFSSFDQELSGEYSMTYDGAGGITASSSGATSPAGLLDGLANIVLNAVNAVQKGPLSFVFGAQMPQLQLGMGIKGFNVAGNVTLVGTTEIATYGSSCDTRKMRILGTAGANASFFGLSTSFGTASLFDKTIAASYPAGCGIAP